MRIPISTVKNAAGLYKQDRFTPIIQSIINLVVSVVLAQYIGLNGILIGTILSSILPCIQRPYIVYKEVLKENPIEYYKQYVKYMIIMAISILIIFGVKKIILISNPLIFIIIFAISILIVHLVMITLAYRKTEEYQYIFNFIREYIKKIIKKVVKRNEKRIS